jgi:hypothetical protein
MKTRSFISFVILAAALSALSALVAQKEEIYSSLQVDDKGQLHILTDSGRDITPAKMESQVSGVQPFPRIIRRLGGLSSTKIPLRPVFCPIRLPVIWFYSAKGMLFVAFARSRCFGTGSL